MKQRLSNAYFVKFQFEHLDLLWDWFVVAEETASTVISAKQSTFAAGELPIFFATLQTA